MNARDRSRFSVDGLRALAGDTAFARGEAYQLGGKVELLADDSSRVLARVMGSQVYRTCVTGYGANIGGECNCRAFADRGFCKHMVAVALAANEGGGKSHAADAVTRIGNYLRAKGVDALVAMLVDLAGRDPALFDGLDFSAAMAEGDDETVEARLRQVIDSAISIDGFVDYHEADGWAVGVREALDAVGEVAHSGRAGMALTLVEHAIDGIKEATESVDDSEGQCTALLHRAYEIHLEACRMARPDPIGLAEQLFERELSDDFGMFSGAAGRYADMLGETGLAEYRRLATDAWAKLPARVGRSEFSSEYSCLRDILDFFAEREADVQARIDIRRKDLSSPWSYLELARFCLSHGRSDEALRWAEEGLWVFEDEAADEPLAVFPAELLADAGRKADADAQLWRAFERSPSLDLYHQLRTFCGQKALDRAVSQLELHIRKGEPIRGTAAADLLIDLLMSEGMFGDAWTSVRKYGVSIYRKEELAEATETTHPAEAIEVYAERVEERIQSGGNSAYEEAARLIARMSGLRSDEAQAAYIAEIRARHQRKRNFIRLLG
jgi:tetratricopeptide (TPR) repeat protein